MRKLLLLLSLCLISIVILFAQGKIKNYFCEYCGVKFSTVTALTGSNCNRHPNGSMKGRHKLYEGSEKSSYTCKYCGSTYSSLSILTGNKCNRHPDGSMKGRHAPAL